MSSPGSKRASTSSLPATGQRRALGATSSLQRTIRSFVQKKSMEGVHSSPTTILGSSSNYGNVSGVEMNADDARVRGIADGDMVEVCNGCGACHAACKVEHGITKTGTWLRNRYENRATLALLTMGRNQCDEPDCMRICPVKAYAKDEDGLVIQDHAKCIGYKACITARSWHKPAFREKDWKISKGDFCAHRLANGLPPACVAACANGTI